MCSAGMYLHENTTHDGMDSKHSNKSPVTLKTKFGAASSKSVACKSVQGSIQGDLPTPPLQNPSTFTTFRAGTRSVGVEERGRGAVRK